MENNLPNPQYAITLTPEASEKYAPDAITHLEEIADELDKAGLYLRAGIVRGAAQKIREAQG